MRSPLRQYFRDGEFVTDNGNTLAEISDQISTTLGDLALKPRVSGTSCRSRKKKSCGRHEGYPFCSKGKKQQASNNPPPKEGAPRRSKNVMLRQVIGAAGVVGHAFLTASRSILLTD
jgi:hypothetical protein